MNRCDQGAKLDILSTEKAQAMADFFKMVGDPGRVQMLFLMKDKEICVQHLSQTLNMSSSAVSHQLRLLRQQNLVKYDKAGKKTYYSLNDEHISSIIDIGLKHINEDR